jgi:hypothetical protein
LNRSTSLLLGPSPSGGVFARKLTSKWPPRVRVMARYRRVRTEFAAERSAGSNSDQKTFDRGLPELSNDVYVYLIPSILSEIINFERDPLVNDNLIEIKSKCLDAITRLQV